MSGLHSDPFPGFVQILPNLGFNPDGHEFFSGMTTHGVLSIIFPNGEHLFTAFKALSEAKFPGIFSKMTPKTGEGISHYVPKLGPLFWSSGKGGGRE